MDASPWGFGAVLIVDGRPLEWFAIWIADLDVEVLSTPRGSCDGQQVWEALVLLIAVRLWLRLWANSRAHLQLVSDNVAALSLAGQLKGDGARRIIAKELALTYAQAAFEPDLLTHLPGVYNVTPDTLSRRYQPGKTWSVPDLLTKVPEAKVPDRTLSWWRSLDISTSS